MGSLKKDEHGFTTRAKANGYGQVDYAELANLLGVGGDEVIYEGSTKGGVRTKKPLPKGGTVKLSPGNDYVPGPPITKAADLPARLRKEAADLRGAGFGGVEDPKEEPWGWSLTLKGLILPGGVRTDAMVVLPNNYPMVSPIGFYLRRGKEKGKLDQDHLFDGRAYHGAQDLSAYGWQWYCGIVQWKPNRYTLVTYLSIVLSLFNENQGATS